MNNKDTAYVMYHKTKGMHIQSIRPTKRKVILDFDSQGMTWTQLRQMGYEVKKVEIRVM